MFFDLKDVQNWKMGRDNTVVKVFVFAVLGSVKMVFNDQIISWGTPYSCPTVWGASWTFRSLFYTKMSFKNLKFFTSTKGFLPSVQLYLRTFHTLNLLLLWTPTIFAIIIYAENYYHDEPFHFNHESHHAEGRVDPDDLATKKNRNWF
jgi:hypothetical protein